MGIKGIIWGGDKMKEIKNAVEELSAKIEHLEASANNYFGEREITFKATGRREGALILNIKQTGFNDLVEVLGILELFKSDIIGRLSLKEKK